MKLLMDTHTHTMASGHAYSTVIELAREAKKAGIKMFALTDHGPDMPGGPNVYHIENQKIIPRKIEDVFILRGVEANIMDFDGRIDVYEKALKKVDLVIASLHEVCIPCGTKEQHTNALIKAIENKYVDIIGHPGNPHFPIDVEKVLKSAKANNVLIEINNSSFGKSRVGSKDNCIQIARVAKDMGVKVVAGTDSHIAFQVGRFENVLKVFKEIDMPEELVINTRPVEFLDFLISRGKTDVAEVKQMMMEESQ